VHMMELTMQQSFLNMGGRSVQLPKIRQKTGQDTAKDAKNGK